MVMETGHQGHRKRLKERFLRTGFLGFDEYGILELLLFYCVPQKDTNSLSHELISQFGSLSNVFDAPYEALIKVDGVGENTAVLLKMVPQLANAYLNDRNAPGVVLDSSQKAGKFMLSKFVGATNERVYLVCLDNKLKLLNCFLISEGGLTAVNFHPREILERAIQCGASSIILSHNHPHGSALASEDDIIMTRKLAEMASVLDITLRDHIIVAGADFISLAQSGVLKNG